MVVIYRLALVLQVAPIYHHIFHQTSELLDCLTICCCWAKLQQASSLTTLCTGSTLAAQVVH